MKIQVLYFEGCPNHQPTVDLVRRVVGELGIDAVIEEVQVTTQADAQRLRFLGSPTIQIDGVDIEPEARGRTDYAFSCRMYGGDGVPPRAMLIAAVTGQGPGPTPAAEGCVVGPKGCCEPQTSEDENTSRNPADRAGLVAVCGSVISAVAASACCWLPLLLIALGLSTGGVASWLAKWRPLFLAAAAALLGTGFYLIYLKKPACESGPGCTTANPMARRLSRVMCWVAVVVILGFSFFPKYAGYLAGGTTTADGRITQADTIAVTLPLEGMTCEACAVHLQSRLEKVPGVTGASVSYTEGRAVVTVDASSPPSRASLIEAARRAGYQVTGETTLP